MIGDIIYDVVRERQKEQEQLIKQAFLRHFGFPIEEVKDKHNFECRMNSKFVCEYCYKGEGFLLLDESDGLDIQKGVNYWRGTITAKYLMI